LLRVSELTLGLALTVASPTEAIDRTNMGEEGPTTDRDAVAARSRDEVERRAAIVGDERTECPFDRAIGNIQVEVKKRPRPSTRGEGIVRGSN
jgi:hypothetical protein